jgi:hypothetical protein
MHYLATLVGLFMTIAAFATGNAWLAAIGIGSGYVIAILSHWIFEGNQPLILVNPFWGAVSDVRMCLLAMTGRLRWELAWAREAGGRRKAGMLLSGRRDLVTDP